VAAGAFLVVGVLLVVLPCPAASWQRAVRGCEAGGEAAAVMMMTRADVVLSNVHVLLVLTEFVHKYTAW
jgi:hypothetical protein